MKNSQQEQPNTRSKKGPAPTVHRPISREARAYAAGRGDFAKMASHDLSVYLELGGMG